MGFTVSQETQTMIVIMFAVYSVIVMGLGLYVRIMSKKAAGGSKVADFLTGGGNLPAIAVGLIMVTNIMSSGGMVGGPGLSYNTGFIWALCVYCSFINIFLSLGGVGKKMNIMSKRTGAQTVLGLFRHRYQSKIFSTIIGVGFLIFLLPYAGSQFIGGGKLFSVVLGGNENSYTIGVFLFAGVTLFYTLTGGIKSMAKVAVFQGAIMIFSVIAIYIGTLGRINEQFGSMEAAMRWVADNNPKILDASSYLPAIFFGTCVVQSFALVPMPHGLIGTFTYDKTKRMTRAMIIGTICYTIIQLTMSGIGPLAYAIHPGLKQGDYVIPMLLSSVVPSWVGGVVIAGVVAAIQSTVAAFLVIISSTIVKDLYKTLAKPDLSEKAQNKGNMIFTILAGVLSMVMALFPVPLLQTIVNFAIGGLACGFLWPMYLGLYWKKATPAGAIVGGASGLLFYILASRVAKSIAMGQHPLVASLVVSGILMIAVSLVTQKVKYGVFQVWFGEDYDDSYAHAE